MDAFQYLVPIAPFCQSGSAGSGRNPLTVQVAPQGCDGRHVKLDTDVGFVSARTRVPEGKFIECFLDVPVEVCERRDPKGLYRKARAGEIAEFTGVSAPYERPEAPELALDTDQLSLAECVDAVVAYLGREGFFDVAADPAAGRQESQGR